MEINSLTSQIQPGTRPDNYLPEHAIPWRVVFFRRVICAVHPELGCYVYHEERWKQCVPMGNDPLMYDPMWYYNA